MPATSNLSFNSKGNHRQIVKKFWQTRTEFFRTNTSCAIFSTCVLETLEFIISLIFFRQSPILRIWRVEVARCVRWWETGQISLTAFLSFRWSLVRTDTLRLRDEMTELRFYVAGIFSIFCFSRSHGTSYISFFSEWSIFSLSLSPLPFYEDIYIYV